MPRKKKTEEATPEVITTEVLAEVTEKKEADIVLPAESAPETAPATPEAAVPEEGAESPTKPNVAPKRGRKKVTKPAEPTEAPKEDAPTKETNATEVSEKTNETPVPLVQAVSSSVEGSRLTISIPRDKLPGTSLDRLQTIVNNKGILFTRALQREELPIVVTEDKVAFPWFTITGVPGEAEAYSQFVAALCQMAVEQKRILEKPYEGDNDKFAMRIFMVRLNMKGEEYSLARKLMMRYLTGNSGWRYGAPPKKAEDGDSLDEALGSPETAPSSPEGDAPAPEAETAKEADVTPDVAEFTAKEAPEPEEVPS